LKTPINLSHKPIISVEDYELIDGKYSKNRSDAKCLSIGYSTFDKKDFSVKVFRNVNGKWSRQSEELPIHRNLDLTILILSILKNENININGFNKKEINSNKIDELIQEFSDPIIFERINEIKRIINL
jgi:hypothetical protein